MYIYIIDVSKYIIDVSKYIKTKKLKENMVWKIKKKRSTSVMEIQNMSPHSLLFLLPREN